MAKITRELPKRGQLIGLKMPHRKWFGKDFDGPGKFVAMNVLVFGAETDVDLIGIIEIDPDTGMSDDVARRWIHWPTYCDLHGID